jgi:hypothetical protein
MGDVRRHGPLLLGMQNYEAARGRIYSSRKEGKKLIREVMLLFATVISKTIYLLISANEQSKKKWENDVRIGIK